MNKFQICNWDLKAKGTLKWSNHHAVAQCRRFVARGPSWTGKFRAYFTKLLRKIGVDPLNETGALLSNLSKPQQAGMIQPPSGRVSPHPASDDSRSGRARQQGDGTTASGERNTA